MKPRKPFLLRLDPALHATLEQWAEQELRSVNGQIEWILRRAVQERFKRDPLPQASDPPAAAPRLIVDESSMAAPPAPDTEAT